jgi:hypothetical protein
MAFARASRRLGHSPSGRRSDQSIGLRFEACVFLLDCWMEGLSRNSAESLVYFCGNGARSCVVLWMPGCRNACRMSIRVQGEYTTTLRVYDACSMADDRGAANLAGCSNRNELESFRQGFGGETPEL